MRSKTSTTLCTIALGCSVLAVSAIPKFEQGMARAADVPNRCMYIYAAAGFRFADMVSSQVRQLDAVEQMRVAEVAISLSRELQCPVDNVTATVDCTLDQVIKNKGAKPDYIDVVQCVESATGRKFPQIAG